MACHFARSSADLRIMFAMNLRGCFNRDWSFDRMRPRFLLHSAKDRNLDRNPDRNLQHAISHSISLLEARGARKFPLKRLYF
jgi:hypothetical protein